jgi:hypothetical protein
MRDEYLIGFVPAGRSEPNSWHPIAVTLRQPGAKAWTRSGFYAR